MTAVSEARRKVCFDILNPVLSHGWMGPIAVDKEFNFGIALCDKDGLLWDLARSELENEERFCRSVANYDFITNGTGVSPGVCQMKAQFDIYTSEVTMAKTKEALGSVSSYYQRVGPAGIFSKVYITRKLIEIADSMNYDAKMAGTFHLKATKLTSGGDPKISGLEACPTNPALQTNTMSSERVIVEIQQTPKKSRTLGKLNLFKLPAFAPMTLLMPKSERKEKIEKELLDGWVDFGELGDCTLDSVGAYREDILKVFKKNRGNRAKILELVMDLMRDHIPADKDEARMFRKLLEVAVNFKTNNTKGVTEFFFWYDSEKHFIIPAHLRCIHKYASVYCGESAFCWMGIWRDQLPPELMAYIYVCVYRLRTHIKIRAFLTLMLHYAVEVVIYKLPELSQYEEQLRRVSEVVRTLPEPYAAHRIQWVQEAKDLDIVAALSGTPALEHILLFLEAKAGTQTSEPELARMINNKDLSALRAYIETKPFFERAVKELVNS